MINPNDPARGSMYLYDDITPPTVDGSYRMTISTNIDYGTPQSAPIDRYFDIVGPRFSLDPTIVASVFPPRKWARRLPGRTTPNGVHAPDAALGAPYR